MDKPGNYGDHFQSRPLRSSQSPQRDVPRQSDYGPRGSPMRSRSPAGHMSLTREQEEDYERRRQEELRRQILLKEKELEKLTSNKDRLRLRIEKQMVGGTQPTRLPPQSLQSPYSQESHRGTESHQNLNDPYRSNSQNPSRPFNTSQPAPQNMNYSTQPQRPMGPRSVSPSASGHQQSRHSPLRQKSGSPQREIQHQSSASLNNPASHEYISQLHTDNASLQRRLNLVLAELDRVSREKNSLSQKFSMAAEDASHLQQMLDEESRNDKGNRNLQVQLNDDRESNKFVRQQMSEVDRRRTEAIQQLRILQSERERNVNNSDELKSDFSRKIALCKELETECHYVKEHISKITAELTGLERKHLDDNRHKHDVQLLIDRLIVERNDLQGKLEQLQRTYDNCVMEVSRERAQMEAHNRHHTKLLVAKSVFMLLESMFQARKQASVNEFFTYCRFDEKCHDTLKTFVGVLDKLGKHKMNVALQQWYSNAFKPIENFDQNIQLSDKFSRAKRLAKAWALWRRKFSCNEDFYSTKNKAVNMIWDWKVKDLRKEKLRAYQIWRDKTRFYLLRLKKIRHLMLMKWEQQQFLAFLKWNNYSKNLAYTVRMHVLAKEYTRDQLMQITFSQLRTVTSDEKRIRQHQLRMYWKAWRDSNQYRKYMMGSEVVTVQFRRNAQTNILKQCFDALRQHKEDEKFFLMTQALDGDCQPAINRVKADMQSIESATDVANKTRGLNCFKRMILANVSSYFNQWKNRQWKVKVGTHKNLKEAILRLYCSKLESAFATWKKGKMIKEVTMQQGLVSELQSEHSSIQGSVDNLSKEIEKERQRVDRSGRVCLTRGIEIMHRRFLKQGMVRWRASCATQEQKEGSSDFILKKMRRRFCRDAFELWKLRKNQMKQDDKDEGRRKAYKELLDARRLRKTFNALCVYRTNFMKARNYYIIILTKMDLWMKRKAYMQWQSQTNFVAEMLLKEEQNNQTGELNSLSKEHKRQALIQVDKEGKNKILKGDLRKMGERLIANQFARCYYKNCAHKFEQWRDAVRWQKHKEAILRRTIDHWRKHIWNFAKAMLKNWIQKSRIHETESTLAHTEMLKDEAIQLNKFRSVNHAETKITLQTHTDQQLALAEKSNDRLSRQIGQIIFKNDKNYFQSQLRFIFLQWRDFTVRQRNFIESMKKVVLKSMWQRGFDNIKAFSKDKQLTRLQNRSIQKLRHRFWWHNCGKSFTKWRTQLFSKTVQITENVVEQTLQIKKEHAVWVEKIKDFNCDRSEKIVLKTRLHNYYQGWKNVTKWLKHARYAKETHVETFGAYKIRRGLKKWLARMRKTQIARDRKQKMFEFKRLLMKTVCFKAMKTKYQRSMDLCLKLHRATYQINTKQCQSAFDMIREFQNAKKAVYRKQQNYSLKDLVSVLHTMHQKRMYRYLSDLRELIYSDKERCAKIKNLFSHFGDSAGTRNYFNRWKNQAKKAETVQEVNEAGPIVEEVLDAQVELGNLQSFMAKEGYTPDQVKAAMAQAKDRNKEKMARVIARLKHADKNTDLPLKPKFFDRWVMLVKLRKLVRHWLHYIANKQKPITSDLSVCFNRWKYFFGEKQRDLSRKPKEYLVARAVVAAKKLDNLADMCGGDSALIQHLLIQRDELLLNYQRSQRMALALARENMHHALMKSLARLQNLTGGSQRDEHEAVLGKNVDLIAHIKSKIGELENDNENLANENEELRQFSLDGYQIAKNVQALTAEREKLSVDLADKATTIRRLLDENENLSHKLRRTQEAAAEHMSNRRRR